MAILGDSAVHRYLKLVEIDDRRGALELVAGLAEAGASVETLVLDLLVPAQREVGLRWERREWTAAQEYAATAIADAALALLTHDAVPSRGARVLVGCVEGEWHLMAARLAAEIFRVRGWALTFLGPSVPAVDLREYATASRHDAVALSCSLPILLPGARRCIRACREGGLPVLVGGAGFAPDGRHAVALGADAWAQDPVAGVGLLEGWLDAPPPMGSPGLEPDEEDLVLEASHAELVAEALHRLVSRAPGMVDVEAVAVGLDMAVAAVESATLVGQSEVLEASTRIVERAMPEGQGSAFAFAPILEGLLPALRQRSPRAAEVVERAVPAIARPL